MDPRFPIYIPSKGRAETRYTMRALDRMCVSYFVIVEEQELEQYAAHIPRDRLLVLDPRYQDEFDTCGETRTKGAGPARNMAWAHAIASGAEWHWIVDDNISSFCRLNRNAKVEVLDGVFFYAQEDFCLRYTNVGMAGPNYWMFAPRKTRVPPMTLNTRIYSCILLRNELPFRWRARYNEDTDLSLRVLKAGWCTVLFNAFLQYKLPTQQVKGGNTTDYKIEGTALKSKMLVDLHPDVTEMTYRFHRAHHYVDYRPFRRNKLMRRADAVIAPGVNNFGMEFQDA